MTFELQGSAHQSGVPSRLLSTSLWKCRQVMTKATPLRLYDPAHD